MGKMIRVSSKGQIVLPKRLRDKLGIREGDYVYVQELQDGFLLLEKPGGMSIDAIAATLREEVRGRRFTRGDLNRAIEESRRAGPR